MKHAPKHREWKPRLPIRNPKPPPDSPSKGKIFPFLRLSGEIRNQIYLDIIGPEVSQPRKIHKNAYGEEYEVGGRFWPIRVFNTAVFVINRQINKEFSDVLWNTLSVEWRLYSYELDKEHLRLFTSMKRLQRCKLITSTEALDKSTFMWCPSQDRILPHEWSKRVRDTTAITLDIDLTVFGLAHKLNRMPQLKEIHIEYWEEENIFADESYWVRFRDGSLDRYVSTDLKDVFAAELRGMTKAQTSGTLCDECAALFASAMERPKEKLPEFYTQEPERCIPRDTVPQWNDKIRGWV